MELALEGKLFHYLAQGTRSVRRATVLAASLKTDPAIG